MKFSDGTWHSKPGYKLFNPVYMFEYQLMPNSITARVLSHEIKEPNDYTSGLSFEYIFSAPRDDMIEVKIAHFKGTVKNAPSFELNCEENVGKAYETDSTLILVSGKTWVEIDKKGMFSYRFYYEDRLLTEGGGGQTAYITDVDYEADHWNDFNHYNALKAYNPRAYIRERLSLCVGEMIYGLGEHFTPLIKNGQNLDIWNRDGGSNTEQGYKCIPFHLSNRGYGVLVNTPDFVDYEVGTESVRHTQFTVESEELDYIVIGAEEPKQVLGKYTEMAGRSPVPPAWSFGLWLSTSWITEFNADQILEIIDKMASYDIPLSVFHFDARWMADFHDCDFVWHKRYGDPREMLKRIHERGVKVCCWINSYVAQPSRLFEEGVKNGYFIKNPDGSVWQTDCWMTGMAVVDFTNPAATKWYTDRLGEILDMGVDCIKTDFGERLPTNVVYYDGSDPRKMHNYYTYLYNKAIYGLLKEKYGEHDAVVFSRSSTVGTQQFPVNWGGDNQASYVSMAESLRGGLSFCQSGFGFWAHDISGFTGTATPDLYKRWAAFGLLSTHSRLHGMTSFRMPWCFDEECCEVLAHFTHLKCRLMPYLYEGAVNVHLHGQPEMRAMMLDFPNDTVCLYLDKQYMLGERLLVAPVFEESGSVEFYVPAGTWTDLQTGECFEGGKFYRRTYDYLHLPLLVRPNSLMPDWAMGFWQCKLRYWNQEQLLNVAREYKRRGLPLDVIVIDFFHWPHQGDWNFDFNFWPDPEAMIKELDEMGVRLMVSIWPTVEPESVNYSKLLSNGYLIRTDRGMRVAMDFHALITHFDATHPGARKFIWETAKKNYFDKGVALFWLDEAEPEYKVYDFELYRYHEGPNVQIGNLSDDQTEYQITDRMSFQRFLGLSLGERVPDAVKSKFVCKIASGKNHILFVTRS